MNIQSSLEFLLLLSAIAALSAGTIAFFGKGIAANKEAVAAFSSMPVNLSVLNASNPNDPKISIYVPLNSTLLSKNTIQIDAYGCSSGLAKITLNSSGVDFSRPNATVKLEGLEMLSLGFEPISQGADRISIGYNVSCPNASLSSTEIFNTYAAPAQAGGTGGQAFAYIKRLNESVIYQASTSPVSTISTWSLCTIKNIWTGAIYTEPGQCGTANSWDYMVFNGGCLSPYWSYSQTYCMAPESTAYSITAPDQYNYTERYSISLSVYTSAGVIHANLSSGGNRSIAVMNGIPIGNATVAEISQSGYPPGPEVVGVNGSWTANQTWYSAYEQAKNAAYSALGFYNASSVSGATQSSIEEAVASFNGAESRLVNSLAPAKEQECSIIGDSFACAAAYPFSYVIDLDIRNVGIGNSSIPYQGSMIDIRSS